MRKTPDSISKAKQRLGLEKKKWQEELNRLQSTLQLDEHSVFEVTERVKYCKEQVYKLNTEIAKFKGKKQFWTDWGCSGRFPEHKDFS
jgi:predicted  nucleic acid-binding Zn-ribbon protein